MRRFQVWWLKISCFLTGYNFYILSNCSEVSVRKVKKYTAALLIVATVWAFVGYCFCSRYMKLDTLGSVFGGVIAVLVILQIERQILLIDKANKILSWVRFGLAFLMAIIGSLIVDQIIFKDDIDKAKLASNQEQVDALLPGRTKMISAQISQLDSSIVAKEKERIALLNDISKNPNILTVETTSSQIPVTRTTTDSSKRSTSNTVLKTTLSKNIKSTPNPKMDQVQPLANLIASLNQQKAEKENKLISLASSLKTEVDSKMGFLDELKIMVSILKESTIALIVYLLWFAFLLLLELLILIGKSNDIDSDYDRTIQKQMEIHLRKIQLL